MIVPRAAALALALCATPGGAGEAPRLGAASSFGQSWHPRVLEGAARLPLDLFRDEIWWHNVETDGAFAFDNPRTTYPDRLPDAGGSLLFLVNNPHPDHDGGTTPATPEGAAAFGRYVARTLERFPGISVIEVGNEMNSHDFAWGPGWEGDLASRAESYVRLLAATARAARSVRPEVEILGGAAHSIPIAWYREIMARGAARHMDALVIHPYTVAPEQLARQIRLLRQAVPETADMPIAVTEFGTPHADTAPAYLLKSYCQQALSGVTTSAWYPLNPRGDGMAALLAEDGMPSRAGAVFRFIRERFEDRPVQDFSPDPFTYGCRFGQDSAVIWGAPRAVEVSGAVSVVDPVSRHALDAADLRLSPESPLVLVADNGSLAPGEGLRLGPQLVVADSFDQFAFPGTPDGGDPFERLARSGSTEQPLETRPGQERDGVPWTPYLGSGLSRDVRADAEWVLPGQGPDGPVEVIYRYTADLAAKLDVSLRLAPWEGGVELSVALNGTLLRHATITDPAELSLAAIPVAPGDRLDFVIGPDGSGGGSDFRVTLSLSEH